MTIIARPFWVARVVSFLVIAGVPVQPSLAQTVPSEGSVAVGAGELYYRVSGSGGPLVLLHGYTSTGAAWDEFVPELAKSFRVLVFDLPGHGKSDRPRENFSHRGVAMDMLTALEKLGVKEFSAVGHSSGGMILLHMALLEPGRLQNMVLVSSGPRMPEDARTMGRQMLFEALPQQMLEVLRQWHPGGDRQIRWLLDQMRRMSDDADEMNLGANELGRISTRTLVVHPDTDQSLPIELAVEMRQHIPNSSLLVVPDSRHEFIVDGGLGSRLLATVMLDFLTRE
jgi:pimeloyl-ACP methyl ester carboxylesterase